MHQARDYLDKHAPLKLAFDTSGSLGRVKMESLLGWRHFGDSSSDTSA
jgi:hypothetical protein